MALFLSKRLIRAFFLLGLVVISLIISFSISDGSVKTYLPESLDISSYIYPASSLYPYSLTGKNAAGSADGKSEFKKYTASELKELLNTTDAEEYDRIVQHLRHEQELKFLESNNFELTDNKKGGVDFEALGIDSRNNNELENEDDRLINKLHNQKNELEDAYDSRNLFLTENEIELERLKKEKNEKELVTKMTVAEKMKAQVLEKGGGKGSTMKVLIPSLLKTGKKPNACLLFVITSFSEYNDFELTLKTIEQMESKFNSKFNYPYVFITENEFTETEKSQILSKMITRNNVYFGTIPKKYFAYPSWIDQNKAATARSRLHKVAHGSSETYRFIQRYLAGYLYDHDLLKNYDWYWRIEPNVEFNCDLQYDIFRWMQDTKHVYGFTLSEKEKEDSVASIWSAFDKYKKEYPELIEDKNLQKFTFKEDNGNDHNTCNFKTSMEFANTNFWKTPAYRKFFELLDKEGGFFYEKWTESMVHTIAVSYFLHQNRINFFKDMGFSYGNVELCPIDNFDWKDSDCKCDQGNDFTFSENSCTTKFYDVKNWKKPDGWSK